MTEKPNTSARGEDDRRSATNPSENPAPKSPQAEEDVVRKGQENLDRVITK